MKCPVCKKNIADNSIKCPYCKTRTGLLCSYCNTINPLTNLKCSKCGHDLLKVCPKCSGINYPSAVKCRKCGSSFGVHEKKDKKEKEKKKQKTNNPLEYNPEYHSVWEGVELLKSALSDKDKKIISVTGEKGCGKTTVLKNGISHAVQNGMQPCIGKCTQLTQLTPGGVIQDMMLNLFALPVFSIKNKELIKNATEFFTKEFKFLNPSEVQDFINFIYNFNDGNYEDIIINKKRTFALLHKIFSAFASTGRFLIIIDNFDFIDGFSAEFITNLLNNDKIRKNIKFIAVYNNPKPISGLLGIDNRNLKEFTDINLRPITPQEFGNLKFRQDLQNCVSEKEKEVIISKSDCNLAYIQQAYSYVFDCQINDKAFVLPETFEDLIKIRLQTLKKSNKIAYKVLCGAAILGDKINKTLIREIFGFEEKEFNDILHYLEMSDFIHPYDEVHYEFNNLLLWETILKGITHDSDFEDLNIKIIKSISIFNLNTNATMAMIAHNLKENRMAFDIWTKTTRLAAYIGDINLYVIAQKQCLALLNEFNESETLNIRYSISEKLGKLLTEYDPEEAVEFLPDAISNARKSNDEVKEIELLGYLAKCCSKTGNYFGNVECADNVLKKISTGAELERAMIIGSKLPSLLDIGNCGEVINLIDHDVLPVLNKYLERPRLSKLFPLGLLFDTWLNVYLILAKALAIQGNDRAFEVLNNLFTIIQKHKINDKLLFAKAKIVQAYANTVKGDINTSNKILLEVNERYKNEYMDDNTVSRMNLVYIINKFVTKDYTDLRENLFDAVTFANNTGDNFTKNILKTLLGKLLKDENKAQHALEIYDEQVTYFAKEKMALGALLSWYLIAEATIVTDNSKGAIDVATQALEISMNPAIDNYFFAVNLRMVLSAAYMNIADYTSAKMNLEEALKLAKHFKTYDLLARIYLTYGKYYYEIGTYVNQDKIEYLRGASSMYEKAMELTVKETQNAYVKNAVVQQKEMLNEYCLKNGFNL